MQKCRIDYLDKIGYRNGRVMQASVIHIFEQNFSIESLKKKKVILFGAGENAIYAEMTLKEKGINIFAYADNSKKLQGKKVRGGGIHSPYEFFGKDEYYFIITVSEGNINQVRLQLMINQIRHYSIFLNLYFHDFVDEDKGLQKTLFAAINTICFENEIPDKVMPYYLGGRWQFAELDFLMYSTLWSHWAYLWEKEVISKNRYRHIMEVGPGYGLMSLVLLKQFQDIKIDWMLLESDSSLKAEDTVRFQPGLKKIKQNYADRVSEFYISIERDSLPEKKYDLIILTEVFEHFALNPVPTMRKIAENLAKNGRIVLTTPNWGHLNLYSTWEEMPYSENVSDEEYMELLKCGHCYQYNKDELISIFCQAGLDVEKYEISDFDNHNFLLVKKS